MRVFSHNNRGVLGLILGDYEGAEQDFKNARATNLRSYVETRQQRAISEIVKQNSARTQQRWAASKKDADQVVAKTDNE